MKLPNVFSTIKSAVWLITCPILQKLFLLFIIGISYSVSIAQTIEWQKCYGGHYGDQIAYEIKQTDDSGFIVVGVTNADLVEITGFHGDIDVWIVKLNSSGTLEWEKCFGGSHEDFAYSILQTVDSGYIFAGYSNSTDGDLIGDHGYTGWVVKLSSTGAIVWQNCIGGIGLEEARAIKQTGDSGYIVTGYTYSDVGDSIENHGQEDYWIVKLTYNGTIEWQKCLGGSNYDEASSIQQTDDGGYIVAGFTNSIDGDVNGNHGRTDFWVVKLGSKGIIEWQKCLGGSNDDKASSIQQTDDGGYIVAGFTNSIDGDVNGNHGRTDFWVVKLGSKGIIEWQKCLGGSNDDEASSIQQTDDGGYIVAGITYSNDGDVVGNHGVSDYWVVKLSSNGTIEWNKCLGGTIDDYGKSIVQTNDGDYIFAGFTFSNNGDISGNHGKRDYWIVKLSAPSDVGYISKNNNEINIYPNPTENMIYLQSDNLLQVTQIKIYNLFGELMTEIKPNKSQIENKTEINLSGFTKGMYFVNIFNNDGIIAKKIIKE